MDVKSAIRSRKSIRKYERRRLPPEVLDELLEAIRLAPSSNNRQAWTMVVVQDRKLKERLAKASGNQRFVAECAVYLVGVADPSVYYSTVDMAIALDHLSLRAVELGVGTCWIGDFDPQAISRILGIPKGREPTICMTVGYPAENPRPKRRKAKSELFCADRWNNPLKVR